jgi:serine/threonine-protein kinase
MGYIDGESLAQRIRRLGRIEARETVRVMCDVADALGYAHAHGVIHRDVKAENILLDAKTGRAMVTDFGIARLAEAAPLTATGQVLGTVYYVSPEQVSGERIDARTDIYSLGVVGFLAVTGRFPFDAELASAVLIAHVTKSAPPVHTLAQDIPRSLADVVDRCLAKDAAARFQSCAELSNALELVHLSDDGSDKSRGPTRMVSDTEAQAIWQRAADLQALTGITPRPPAVGEPIARTLDSAVTHGFDLTQIRDAAVEAGIPVKYVEQVFAERGLAASQQPAALKHRNAPANPFIGSPTRIEYEVVLDGEMPTSDYDLLLDVIRRNVGESGTLASVGRSFTWQSAGRRTVQVSVLPRGGKTTIRVSENLRNLAGGLLGGIMGGYGGGSSGIWIGIGIGALHNPALAAALWLGNIALAYGVARGVFRRMGSRRGDELRTLAEALASEARASIDAAQPKLPRGTRG